MNPLPGYMHPSYPAYRDGCRCTPCVTAKRRKQKVYRVYGTVRVPADKSLATIDRLVSEGYPIIRIAEAAGVPQPTVSRLVNRRWQRIHRDTAARLETVTRASIIALSPPGAIVPALGTQRRIHALARLGWTFHQMADNDQALRKMIGDVSRGERQRITVASFLAVKAIYDRMSMEPGGSVQTISRATRNGWAPPLAWDDDTIDSPDATPDFGGADRGRRELYAAGLCDRAIASEEGVTRDAIRIWRKRHGLDANYRQGKGVA